MLVLKGLLSDNTVTSSLEELVKLLNQDRLLVSVLIKFAFIHLRFASGIALYYIPVCAYSEKCVDGNSIVACHLPRAPSYGGVRTWVEGSQIHGGPRSRTG